MENLNLLFVLPFLFAIPTVALLFPVWAMRRRNRYAPLVENRLRLPAESTHQMLIDLFTDVLGYYMMMFASIAGLLFIVMQFDYHIIAVVITVVGGVFSLSYQAYRLYVDFQKAMNFRVGADGEAYTGQELNLLARSGAFVFHDIPYKYGNIDHVVVGFDAIFAVETKAVRKPVDTDGKREGRVVYDGRQLVFPHHRTDAPLKQARCHADYLRLLIKRAGCNIPVVAVVAIPGWYVESNGTSNPEVLVMNPKRGRFLCKKLGERRKCDQFDAAVSKIESIARMDSPLSSITDPDAADHYNLWTNEPKVNNS
jgi:hypothetical protein